MKESTLEFLKTMATDANTFNANLQHYNLLDGIRNNIQEAWEIWDDEYTRPFWGADEKPMGYTHSFAHDWIVKEDFDADGYDEQELDELFGK